MDEELKTLWNQLRGWSLAIHDMAERHMKGEPCEDVRDHRLPREHMEGLLKGIGEIYEDIKRKESA